MDYIKKAKEAGQSDEQTRSILYKSGWTEQEVGEAYAVLNPQTAQTQPKPQPQAQPQVASQPKIDDQPKVVQQQVKPQAQVQPKIEPAKTTPQYQSQPKFQQQPTMASPQSDMPRIRKSHLFLKLIMVLIILVILGGAGYFVAGQYIKLPYLDAFTKISAPKPEVIISKMMANMKSVKTSHAVLQGNISAVDSKNVAQGKLFFSAEYSRENTLQAPAG